MSIKGLFTIAAGYVAGSIISSIFSKKTPTAVKKELDKSKSSTQETLSVLFNNFLETQKNFFESVKTELTTEENMKILEEKKAQALSLFDEYKKEAQTFIGDLTSKDPAKVAAAKEKLENIYNTKKARFEKTIEELPETTTEIKTKLLANFEDFKNKFKS